MDDMIVGIKTQVSDQAREALPLVVIDEPVATVDLSERDLILAQMRTLAGEGTAVLASSDPIRVKVKPRSYVVKRDPARFYRRLLEEGGLDPVPRRQEQRAVGDLDPAGFVVVRFGGLSGAAPGAAGGPQTNAAAGRGNRCGDRPGRLRRDVAADDAQQPDVHRR